MAAARWYTVYTQLPCAVCRSRCALLDDAMLGELVTVLTKRLVLARQEFAYFVSQLESSSLPHRDATA